MSSQNQLLKDLLQYAMSDTHLFFIVKPLTFVQLTYFTTFIDHYLFTYLSYYSYIDHYIYIVKTIIWQTNIYLPEILAQMSLFNFFINYIVFKFF